MEVAERIGQLPLGRLAARRLVQGQVRVHQGAAELGLRDLHIGVVQGRLEPEPGGAGDGRKWLGASEGRPGRAV